MRDPYAEYRDWSDPFWQPTEEPRYTYWDFALAEAWQAKKNFHDDTTGQPRWLTDDPDVDWKIGTSVNFAEQQLEEAYEKQDKNVKGVHLFLTDPYKNGEFWGIEEWLDFLENEEKQLERNAPQGGHKPTAAENAKRRADREARIKAALEGIAEDPSIE